MSMKVVTKLDLGHDFGNEIQILAEAIKNSTTAPILTTHTNNLIAKVGQIARDAYSLGVEQGIKQDTNAKIPIEAWGELAVVKSALHLMQQEIEGLKRGRKVSE